MDDHGISQMDVIHQETLSRSEWTLRCGHPWDDRPDWPRGSMGPSVSPSDMEYPRLFMGLYLRAI